MASVSFVPYEDPNNVIQAEPERMQQGTKRIVGKTFVQDGMPNATPRKALGDVKNFKSNQIDSAVKMPPQSARKFKSSINSNSRTGFDSAPRPIKSTKKDKQNEIKVFDDFKEPQEQLSAFKEKENMTPYIYKEPEFEMPEYLSTVLKGNLIESTWWPTFSRSPPKSDADDLDFDFTSMKLDKLPSREDIKEPSTDIVSYQASRLRSDSEEDNLLDDSDYNILPLEELEAELNAIDDAFCNF